MTREEVYTKIFNDKKIDRNSKKYIDKIIKEIYDDLDRQICKNCIHYDKDDKVCILLDMGVLNNTFGCKEFKLKG